MVKKAAKRLYILRVLSRISVPSSDLLTIYFALVRYILEYACPLWHTNLPLYLSDKTEHVQKRAFRIIYPGHGCDDALSIAQCPRLKDRRQNLCHRDMHGRYLRTILTIVPKCRTDMCSVIPKQ